MFKRLYICCVYQVSNEEMKKSHNLQKWLSYSPINIKLFELISLIRSNFYPHFLQSFKNHHFLNRNFHHCKHLQEMSVSTILKFVNIIHSLSFHYVTKIFHSKKGKFYGNKLLNSFLLHYPQSHKKCWPQKQLTNHH